LAHNPIIVYFVGIAKGKPRKVYLFVMIIILHVMYKAKYAIFGLKRKILILLQFF